VPEPADVDGESHGADEAEERNFASGGDRRRLRLSEAHEAMIATVAAANPRTVVALQGGSMVLTTPWRGSVAAVLYTWYAGMEGGHALADVLTGDAEPGGRLPFVEVVDDAHLPYWDPDADEIVYDRWHGQWLVDRDGHDVTTPFGGGLGYGDLDWGEVSLAGDATSGHTVTVTLHNVGDRTTKEVVQVYGADPTRPDRPRRLVGFAAARLEPGTTAEVSVSIDRTALGVWDADRRVLGAPTGPITLDVGSDARTVMATFELG